MPQPRVAATDHHGAGAVSTAADAAAARIRPVRLALDAAVTDTPDTAALRALLTATFRLS